MRCFVSFILKPIIYSILVDIERVSKLLSANLSNLTSKRLQFACVEKKIRFIQEFELSFSGETDFVTVSKYKLNRFTRGCHFMLNLKCLLLIFILENLSSSTSFNSTISFDFLRKKNEIFVKTAFCE